MKRFNKIYRTLLKEQTNNIVAVFLHMPYLEGMKDYQVDTYNSPAYLAEDDFFWTDEQCSNLHSAHNLKEAINILNKEIDHSTFAKNPLAEMYGMLKPFENEVDEWRVHYSGDVGVIMGKISTLKTIKNHLSDNEEDDISGW